MTIAHASFQLLDTPSTEPSIKSAFYQDSEFGQAGKPLVPRAHIQVPMRAEQGPLPLLWAQVSRPLFESKTYESKTFQLCLYQATWALSQDRHLRERMAWQSVFRCDDVMEVTVTPRPIKRISPNTSVRDEYKLQTLYQDDVIAILRATIQWTSILARDSSILLPQGHPFRPMSLNVLRANEPIGSIVIQSKSQNPLPYEPERLGSRRLAAAEQRADPPKVRPSPPANQQQYFYQQGPPMWTDLPKIQ